MPILTLDVLRAIMRSCGVEDEIDLDGDIMDVDVEDLGYDSLAMIYMAAVIKDQTTVSMDDMLEDLRTPRAILEFVNNAHASKA
jgi:act minimal PKS acyl carrier protein